MLQLQPLAFGDLVELLRWDPVSPIVGVEAAEPRGERSSSSSSSLVPRFDVLADLRSLLEELMEGVVVQQEQAKQEAAARQAWAQDAEDVAQVGGGFPLHSSAAEGGAGSSADCCC